MSKEPMREMVCINCPIGCNLKVYGDSEDSIRVEGNKCPRGEKYGRDEVLSPRRMVTSSIPLRKDEKTGIFEMVSVKTESAVPKGLIFQVLSEIKKVKLKAPVEVGDVILKNVSGTGIDVVATQKREQ